MRFDDRLLTVLNQPSGDRHDLAVRWRQLVDLIARAGDLAATPLGAEALNVIRVDAAHVDEDLRAAAARAIAALPLPFGLIEIFAGDRPQVSAPVLAAATLEPEEWQALRATADPETAEFIRTLQPELHEQQAPGAAPETIGAADEPAPAEQTAKAAPPAPAGPDVAEASEPEVEPELQPEPGPPAKPEPEAAVAQEADAEAPAIAAPAFDSTPEPEAAPAPEPVLEVSATAAAIPSIHELVERIERRRIARTVARDRGASPADGQGSPRLFRWECGPGGDIAWVDGAPRAAVIGCSIARSSGAGLDPAVAQAFSARAPFRDGLLRFEGEGALSGEWKISGVPAFEPTDGRFAGYRGVALRESAQDSGDGGKNGAAADPASIRELVHEIKTPLNAIIGFAEIIEGQLLGPAGEHHRARAREIVRQARLLLTAVEDLDFAAKVHSAAAGAGKVNVGELVERIMPALSELASNQEVTLTASPSSGSADAQIQPELAERLIQRLCSALVSLAERGEQLWLSVGEINRCPRVSVSRPRALGGVAEREILGGDVNLGAGFPLRLVSGLARSAGAELSASGPEIALLFTRA